MHETCSETPFSEAEYACRYSEVRQVLEEQQLAGVLCYGNRGVPGLLHYLANFTPRWESFLFFPVKGEPLLLVQLYNHAPDAKRRSVIGDTRWGGEDSIHTLAAELELRRLNAGVIGLAGPLPYQRYAGLQRATPHVHWKDVSAILGQLRWVKSAEEIERVRVAAALTDLAMAALAEGVRPGVCETDLAPLMETAVASRGGRLELCYLASTGMTNPNVCVPAQNPANRQLETGDVIITEIGAGCGGYAGQIHRPIAVNAEPTKRYRQLFDVALEAYQKVADAIHPGATEQDVLSAAEVIHDRGYSIYDDLVHGFGGGYLPPVLRTRATSHGEIRPFTFQENMCVVVQPNIITPDERMGLQLGQLHLVTSDGLESLQNFPLEFIISQSS